MKVLIALAPILTAIVLIVGCTKGLEAHAQSVTWPTNSGVLVQTSLLHIAEDDPNWDCHMMGNHLCSPKTRRIDR